MRKIKKLPYILTLTPLLLSSCGIYPVDLGTDATYKSPVTASALPFPIQVTPIKLTKAGLYKHYRFYSTENFPTALRLTVQSMLTQANLGSPLNNNTHLKKASTLKIKLYPVTINDSSKNTVIGTFNFSTTLENNQQTLWSKKLSATITGSSLNNLFKQAAQEIAYAINYTLTQECRFNINTIQCNG
ncbi:hypothetical protein ACGP04_04735 [Piscirickettsia salmonis]|uniref:hypothetical protein n=1 Tax=Piscirickettsia salmonis TaxID=1238 RepID=UPI000F0961EF|nr:hypothetical protein DA717_12855 [Piscirickettsiaceae bacterium NZ-RLO2]